jgi:hypothetical protein
MQQHDDSDDQQQPPYSDQPDQFGPPRSRSGDQAPQYGQQAPYPGQPQYGQQAPYPGQQPYQQPPTPPKKKTGRKIAGFGCLGIVAIFVLVAIVTAVGGTKAANTAASAATPTSAAATTAAHGAAPASAAPAAPAASQAPVAQQVVFKCTGSAPDGVNITYGPEGTNDSASSLPFTTTVPLNSGAQYYNVTAQLQGSGQVSCSTVVNWGGQSVTQTGSANGGYNLASAEICSDFSGGWQTC